MESNKKTILSKIVIVSAVFLMLSLCIVPASALDPLPGNNETMITMTNGAYYNTSGDDYYFKFTKDGGGLKSIHISDSPEYDEKSGENYGNNLNSGTFYITDTSKDPGYSDSAILLFGVPSDTSFGRDFSVQITASGYNWAPTGDGSFPSSPTHYNNVNIGTFYEGNFIYTDNNKPYFDDDYPLYYNAGTSNYDLMFIDLSLGTLNRSFQDTLTDNGSIKIDYVINDFSGGSALFDVYTWCNQSTQGDEVVSWTNKIASGGSDWTIGF